MFEREMSVSVQGSAAFNTWEDPTGNHVQGGTAILNFDDFTQYAQDYWVDPRGLGRWSWTLVYGSQSHSTQIIQAYNVGWATCKGLGTIYQQHLHYVWDHDLQTTPCELFRMELLDQLCQWRVQGDQLVLMMDANEHVLNGPLCKDLVNDNIDLVEATHASTILPTPPTSMDGSKPIDRVWHTSNIELTNINVLPFGESVGDHHSFVFDISSCTCNGWHAYRMQHPLVTSNAATKDKYTAIIEDLEKSVFYPASPEQKAEMDRLDK